jgi:thymidylate kinase
MSFYIVEGPNGAGKTTLINNLQKQGIKTLSSPNGTPLAQMLRPACRGTDEWKDVDKSVQFLLFSAARLDEYIRLVKDVTQPVVADRWWTSTYVYQVVLGGIATKFMEYTVHPMEKIDRVILLDGRDDVLIDRCESERKKNTSHGTCRWTQDWNTMQMIMKIYRIDLPKYLDSRKIPHTTINVTNLSTEKVMEETLKIIKG